MKITELENKHRAEYKTLSEKHGSVFSTLDWVSIYGKELKLYSILNDDGQLIGGFHLFIKTTKGITRIMNPPYTPTIGLFYENAAQNKANRLSFDKDVMTELVSFLKKIKNSVLMISLPDFVIDTQPFYWNGFKVVPNYTYKIDLSQSIEQMNSDMASLKRTNLRKNTTDGIVVEKASDLKIVKKLILKTFDRKDKSVDIKLMDKILFEYAKPENSFAYISYKGSEPIACSFCAHDNKTAYYLFGGYDSANKHRGAGPGAMWASVTEAKNRGMKYFDFEGSMIPEVEKYFRGFGGDLTPYYTINKAKLPVEMLLKLNRRNRF